MLIFIDDLIDTTLKLDKNTITRETGKYASLCIQIDFRKPLLAIFLTKGWYYKLEQEGLHFLCLTCGRFGHYKEECLEMRVAKVDMNEEEKVLVKVHGEDMMNIM